jgi:hypothetical protein
MNKIKFLSISVGSYLLLMHTVVSAGWFGADFSAEVVQGTSQGQDTRGRMYVSKGRVRTEMEQNGERMIEIIDPLGGVAWVVDPQQQSYQERAVPKISAADKHSANPCNGIAAAQCRQLPDEILNGRSTKKWQVRHNGKERMQWNDARHGFPIQVVERGQVVMAMVYVSEERLGERPVERWRALQHSGKAVVESEQWYDPQLNIAIRQQAKDGSFRELRNIRLGEQPDELFTLPQGYSKMDAAAR